MSFLLTFLFDLVAIYAIFKGFGLLIRTLGALSARLGDSCERRILDGPRKKSHPKYRKVKKDGEVYLLEEIDD